MDEEISSNSGLLNSLFAKSTAAVAIVGLVLAMVGTGLNANQQTSGMGTQSEPGTLFRVIGMLSFLFAATAFVTKSVLSRARERANQRESRDASNRPAVRIRILIVAARILGFLLIVISAYQLIWAIYFVSTGWDVVSQWYESIVLVILTPTLMVSSGVLMLSVAEILDCVTSQRFQSKPPPRESGEYSENVHLP